MHLGLEVETVGTWTGAYPASGARTVDRRWRQSARNVRTIAERIRRHSISIAVQLEALLEGVDLRVPLPGGAGSIAVMGLCFDSRKAAPGDVFVAFAGAKADGRKFARQAMERGCVAVVSDLDAPEDFNGLWIHVEDGRKALALMARTLFIEAARAVR